MSSRFWSHEQHLCYNTLVFPVGHGASLFSLTSSSPRQYVPGNLLYSQINMEERYEIFSSPDCSQMSFQNSEHATWGLIEDNAGPPLEDLIGDFVPQSASNVTAQNVSQSAEFDPEIYALFATPPKGDQAVQYVVGTASGVENPVVSPALQASPSSAGCSDDSYNVGSFRLAIVSTELTQRDNSRELR